MPQPFPELLASLEARVQILEDTLAIHRMIVGYPAALDSGTGEAVISAWSADGVFDRGGGVEFKGAQVLAAQVETPEHHALLDAGFGHMVGPPTIAIDGNHATATCYMQMLKKDGDVFRVQRFTVNRWELEKSDGRWKFIRRTNRLLDGSIAARDLLRDAAKPLFAEG
jgi:hypothetical protein